MVRSPWQAALQSVAPRPVTAPRGAPETRWANWWAAERRWVTERVPVARWRITLGMAICGATGGWNHGDPSLWAIAAGCFLAVLTVGAPFHKPFRKTAP